MIKLSYLKGTLLIDGDYNIPHVVYDERINKYRAEAFYYGDIIRYLKNSDLSHEDNVLNLIPCPNFTAKIRLRKYQKEAFKRWMQTKKGVIVMPTGSGKTIIAMKIIEKLNTSTFIVVPTLDLTYQWKEQLEKEFSMKIGEFSSRQKELLPITVSTYQSAYIHAENLGNKFKLLIFDEVHHLPSESFRHIAEMFASPFRLGLTATYERADGLHGVLPKLVGGKIYEIEPASLAGTFLADHEIKKIMVSFTEQEQQEYKAARGIFTNYLLSHHIKMQSPSDFNKLVMRAGRDLEARKALLAKNKADKIAFNSENKLKMLSSLLKKSNKTIIFTRYNSMVYKISRQFFIPCITHETNKEERIKILNKFKEGTYSAIVSSQVLDEGINVPEANIGIIFSGTGSSREYVQRLGRLLRPAEHKKAILYEMITKDSIEIRTSYRRRS
ncbi:MAG: DEAD/DEAH box helicase [Promethearchaeota archaeon]